MTAMMKERIFSSCTCSVAGLGVLFARLELAASGRSRRRRPLHVRCALKIVAVWTAGESGVLRARMTS